VAITIESGVLARAMRSAAAVIERANTIPILANVCLRADGERLEIITTNLDVEYRQHVPLAQGGAFNTTIDAQKLAAIAAATEGAQISLDDAAGINVVAKAGRSRWVLPALKSTDFPELPFDMGQPMIRMEGKDLATVVSRLAWSICTDELRYYMCGIYIDPEGDKLRYAAANGFTFASVISDIAWPIDAPPVIMASKFTRLVEKLAVEAGEVSLCWDSTKVRFTSGDVVLTGKVIEGKFPQYRNYIPAEQDRPILVDPASLRKALKRIEIIGMEKTRGIAVDVIDGGLDLRVPGTATGEASEHVPAECAALHRAGFNAGYLHGALEAIGGDTVEIHQGAPGEIALIRRKVADGMIAGVMPMRV